MNSWIHAVLSAATAVTAGNIALFLLRVTLIAAIGRLALALMPRASAASRHLVATMTLVALVALPLAMAFLPQWRLAILPRRDTLTASPALQLTSAETFVKRTYDSVDGDTPYAATAVVPHASPAPTARSSRLPLLPRIPRLPSLPAPPLPWPLLLALLALGCSEAMLLRCGLSLAAAAWFARCASDVDDDRVQSVFAAAHARLGLRRDVSLRITPRISVPVVSGLLRPTLLLPMEALGWTAERLNVVFLHELAHVQRCDTLSILLARTSGALYWFHPLVRSLVRDARRECEQACDDRVLDSGVRASAYAEHLLTIARGAAGREALGIAVLAIARPSNLEQRLSSILRLGVERGPATRRAVAAAALLSALFVLPLASVRVTAAPARTVKSHSDTLVWQSTSAPTAATAATRPSRATRPVRVVPAAPPTPAALAPADGADPADPTPAVAPLADSPLHRSGGEWYDRARRYYERDRFGEAGVAYERAARAGHNIETAYYNAACSYALDHQSERALAMLDAAVKSGWGDVHMLQSDDDLESIRGDRRFHAIVEAARASDSDDGDRKSAVAEYEALRSNHSDDASAWGDAGVELMHSGDPVRAVDAFETQIRLEPGSSNAVYNLACAHAINGASGPALDALGQAVAAGYSDADHMRDDDDLASLRGTRRFDELVRMTENLELNPDDLGDNAPRSWRDELPRYQRVSQLYPSVGRAWFNLGYAQLRARDLDASRSSFGRALDLKYRPGVTSYDLACVCAQLHETDMAMRWLDRAETEGMNLGFYLAGDRDLDPIRSDARFRAMRHRVEDEQWERGRQKFKRGLDKLGRAFDKF